MDKNYEQVVPEEVRDKVFSQIKNINKNNMCIDCEKKNPKWSSIHLGLHLCIDCAGKHRQYGVMYSFVKSTNLDAWNQKQLLFMEKGGNARALDYFRKCGILSETHKHIEYKSPIVQKYKEILTAEVEAEIHGKPLPKKDLQPKKKEIINEESLNDHQTIKEIPNAQTVKHKEEKGKKKGKKKIGTKMKEIINVEEVDDGVPIEERDKIIKAYEGSEVEPVTKQKSYEETDQTEEIQESKTEEVKELTEEEANKKLEEIKVQKNVKSISSDAFKDNSTSQMALKQNLNKFQNSSSISSSAFFGEKEETGNETMGKMKDTVMDVGGKIYNKLSSWGWGNKS